MWEKYVNKFKISLKSERNLSNNTIISYLNDIKKLETFFIDKNYEMSSIDSMKIKEFIYYLNSFNTSDTSQKRILSGVKCFVKFLITENVLKEDISIDVSYPKTAQKLPNVLSIEEIDELFAAINVRRGEGLRNRAILETLYSSGVRVSELVNMKLNDIREYKDFNFISVIGKGNKQRLVPLGKSAMKYIEKYLIKIRSKMKIDEDYSDYLFLNTHGRKLTTVMIFTIIKQLTTKLNWEKQISPHTFRHSFATHLLQNGANLRAIQELLGHENISTTEIYLHLDITHLKKTIDTLHPRSTKCTEI